MRVDDVTAAIRGASWPRIWHALYVIGSIVLLTGCCLFIPAASRMLDGGDPLLLIGAPLALNGIWLFLAGIVVGAIGKAIQLLTDLADLARPSSEPASDRIVVRCPNPSCRQGLRVNRTRSGSINCPKCGSSFNPKTIAL